MPSGGKNKTAIRTLTWWQEILYFRVFFLEEGLFPAWITAVKGTSYVCLRWREGNRDHPPCQISPQALRVLQTRVKANKRPGISSDDL